MKHKTSLIILSCSLLLIFIWSCGELEKGRFPTNAPPQLYLVNIPTEDASFTINPLVYWWGTDSDGRIMEYQYLVIPESKMDGEGNIVDLGLIAKDANGLIDSLFVKAIEGIPHTEWVDTLIAQHLNQAGYRANRDSLTAVIDTQTSVNLIMFAELDTTIYVNQYFFVRGVDNDGAVSKIWRSETQGGNVFRRLSRNNHPPNTHIDTVKFAKTGVYYCLPETTMTWKGIKLEWEGSDSSDYPGSQPDFYYKWELYGPFDDTANANLNVIVDSSWNDAADTRWVLETSRTFVNLKNYNEENGGHHGWYLFRVNSRDDAFVVDETPAEVFIHVVHPLIDFWPENQRKVLMVDASMYGSRRSYGFPQEENGRIKVLNIYNGLFSAIAGDLGISYDIWYDSTVSARSLKNPPNELLLSQYKLVIVLNHCETPGVEGPSSTSRDSGYVQYTNYLNVGGSVWFLGLNSWTLLSGGWHETDAGAPRSGFNGFPIRANLARSYFGLLKVFYPSWGMGNRNDEFIGANPFLEVAGFPYLESDSIKVDTVLGWRPTEPLVLPFHNAVPEIGALVLSARAERLYDFVSLFGMNSKLNGKPCAARYIGSSYKTAEFSFPLFIIKEDQAKEVMKLMINWFLQPIAS